MEGNGATRGLRGVIRSYLHSRRPLQLKTTSGNVFISTVTPEKLSLKDAHAYVAAVEIASQVQLDIPRPPFDLDNLTIPKISMDDAMISLDDEKMDMTRIQAILQVLQKLLPEQLRHDELKLLDNSVARLTESLGRKGAPRVGTAGCRIYVQVVQLIKKINSYTNYMRCLGPQEHWAEPEPEFYNDADPVMLRWRQGTHVYKEAYPILELIQKILDEDEDEDDLTRKPYRKWLDSPDSNKRRQEEKEKGMNSDSEPEDDDGNWIRIQEQAEQEEGGPTV